MSRREFVSSLATGLVPLTTRIEKGRPAFSPKATFVREAAPGPGVDPDDAALPASETLPAFDGPGFSVMGPGDVVGFDTGTVVRCTPADGTLDATSSDLACVDLADARLPWLLSLPAMQGRPWLTLIVLRDDEYDELVPPSGARLTTVTAPASALPPPATLAAFAHVEVRLDDGEAREAVLQTEARSGTDRVVARLVCPRKLDEHRGWLACVVPATRAGVAAGLGSQYDGNDPGRVPWEGGGSPMELPVYYAWSFRTGGAGSFEELARRLKPLEPEGFAGLGQRTLDVSHPFVQAPRLVSRADPADRSPTVVVQGALRVPGSAQSDDAWSSDVARAAFRTELARVLDEPAIAAGGADADRDVDALAPPLFGSHHTGVQTTTTAPAGGWVAELNRDVRHRVAASLGARYVQVEQEFLMARAWEQVGEVRAANQRLAQAELAAVAAETARIKHLTAMDPQQVTVLSDVVDWTIRDSDPGLVRSEVQVGDVLGASAVPDGVAGIAFRRLARRQGAVARRTARARAAGAGGMPAVPESVLVRGLRGEQSVPLRPSVALAAQDAAPLTVARDAASTYGRAVLADMVTTQSTMFAGLVDEGAPVLQTLSAMSGAMGGGVSGSVPTTTTPPASALREARRSVLFAELLPDTTAVAATLGVDSLADAVRTSMVTVSDQLGFVAEAFAEGAPARDETAVRPLRPIMEHPRFGFPIAAELLSRWPEWTLPGITTFPDDRCALLETNPAFVESLLVGLNQEFDRELLWREYPTDQAGTPFARFWPAGPGGGGLPPLPEIARWPVDSPLGSHDPSGNGSLLALFVRAEVLRRHPGTHVLAVTSVDGKVPDGPGEWQEPIFALPVDDRTSVFGFRLTMDVAVTQKWLFVLREPVRTTRFGFDERTVDSPALTSWADLTWAEVPLDRGFVDAAANVPRPGGETARWQGGSAHLASIAFQRPFQLAFSPRRLVGEV